MLSIYLNGFLVTISLIVAIGAQNAYLLKLGLLKQYVLLAVVFCILCDMLLITIGVLGLGLFVSGNQFLLNTITIIGIVFLLFYAFNSFKAAFTNASMRIDEQIKTNPLKKVVSLLVVFTFLNPHTYLDTILLVGGIGSHVEDSMKIYFLLGAYSASATWFFSLGFGARVLIPLFKKPLTWKILDIMIGLLMTYISYSLLDLIK